MGFEYHRDQFHLVSGKQSVSLLHLASEIKQAFYIYDLDGILKRMQYFKKCTSPARPYYSMKANSHPGLLKALCFEGVGVDVVSGGEITLALQAGFTGKDIIFSGVGKTAQEIMQGLQEDILQFNVESVSELKKIAVIAQKLNKKARVAFRMNPNIDVETHPYIKTGLREHKFGLDEENLPELQEILESPFLNLYGLTLHIGSQIHDLQALESSIRKIQSLYHKLKQEFDLKTFSVGGGLGIDYKQASLEKDHNFIRQYGSCLKKLANSLNGEIFTEPGRIITARLAVLLERFCI